MEIYAIAQLLDWKQSKRRKPLIVESARQVGKTWSVKEFAQLATICNRGIGLARSEEYTFINDQ